MSDAPLILAFDSSAAHCAAALVRGEAVLAARAEAMERGQAERLPLLIEELRAEAGAALDDVARIGVGIGPGNFTGVRIAVALARGLALALGRPAVGVSRLAALHAALTPGRAALAVAAGRRGQILAQPFAADGAPLAPAAALTPAEAAERWRALQLAAVAGAREGGAQAARALGAAFVAGPGPAGDAPDPVAIARLAAGADPRERPAPIYLRPADAAPPAEAPPPMLD
ncbi:tRNA (adenosine(37)-N6)-threonylcarbamoyltransferase complex dimerization subunit type 1 TsaB [Oceanicella actignis]|uniref:tRNA (adenosine(37)-N6)-threonylcarbamoyltransferase complex dimerization subunit type 1 TsaB n=1 Tax=Oceanicella actignis TaxID=1189325 RepID=UPI0011E86EC3|nr:tRNA (adenosine(37)-N6)-threonylcarbamoyltransferase complex dimerization subunit type 1 TsaB [Oceanicella actignis]TYO89196.1 tRNA threonylcarbamoyl adenosine modification protein YeaZ [Oceanicella actignis]